MGKKLFILNENGEKELDQFDSNHPYYILDWNDSIQHKGHTLYRVIYKDGDIGGYIESYDNLAQDGSRVLNEEYLVSSNNSISKVYGKSRLSRSENSKLYAVVSDGTEVCDSIIKSCILGHCSVVDSNLEEIEFSSDTSFLRTTVSTKMKHKSDLKYAFKSRGGRKGSQFEDSKLQDCDISFCRVYESEISNSELFNSQIYSSNIDRCEIEDMLVKDETLSDEDYSKETVLNKEREKLLQQLAEIDKQLAEL